MSFWDSYARDIFYDDWHFKKHFNFKMAYFESFEKYTTFLLF